MTGVQPVDVYLVKVTFPAANKSSSITEEIIVESDSTFLVVPSTHNGIDYSTASVNIV